MKRKVGAGKKHRGQFYIEVGFCAVDAVCVSEVKGFSTYSGLLYNPAVRSGASL
jgi:hypothetical protein